MSLEPTDKAPEIDKFLTALSGKDRKEIIRTFGCIMCSRVFPTEKACLESFRDELSKREYEISGICQSCQGVFIEDEPA